MLVKRYKLNLPNSSNFSSLQSFSWIFVLKVRINILQLRFDLIQASQAKRRQIDTFGKLGDKKERIEWKEGDEVVS